VEKVRNEKDFAIWFNAKTWEYEDMVQAWIIDPAKVLRVSLENAVSAAAMILTTDAVITDLPKKENHSHDHDHGGMGWMWGMGGMGMM
jgi:chaperonin GroEL